MHVSVYALHVSIMLKLFNSIVINRLVNVTKKQIRIVWIGITKYNFNKPLNSSITCHIFQSQPESVYIIYIWSWQNITDVYPIYYEPGNAAVNVTGPYFMWHRIAWTLKRWVGNRERKRQRERERERVVSASLSSFLHALLVLEQKPWRKRNDTSLGQH